MAASTAETPTSAASVAQSTKSKEESKDGEEGGEVASGNNTQTEAEDSSQDEPPKPLYKSTRLKGYITLLLASAINYSSARRSDEAILNAAVPADQTQKNYAMSVSMVTIILSITTVLIHLDRSPLKKYWAKAFEPKSKIELGLILFLVLWWVIGTWIQVRFSWWYYNDVLYL